VTAQVALTLVLLVGAGLFARTLRNLGRVELGLKPDGIVGFAVSPASNGYAADRTAQLARRLTESLSGIPGVSSVSAAELPTLANSDYSTNAKLSTDPPGPRVSRRTYRNFVGPAYFSTLGVPLVAGREFRWDDDIRAPKVAILNETAAHDYFPGRSAIGERLAMGTSDALDIEIVGVVKDSKSSDVGEKPRAYAYTPYLQDPKLTDLTFYLRGEGDAGRFGAPIREAVKRLDPQLPVYDLKTLPQQISESLLTQRLIVIFSAAFAGLAALLAAIGIYGVLAFSVAQRRQEIGVRMALGADPSSVRRLVLRDVLRFVLVGGAIGLPVAWALGRVVESLLFGVKAADAPVLLGGAALMAAVALVAGYLPARRASRVDPLDALRSE
jgi:predicted permease